MSERTTLPSLGPVLELLRVLWAVDHAYQRSSRRMHDTIGVTAAQRLVLRLVGRFPGLGAGQLAEVLRVHPSTMTGILKRLERQGLISRRVDPRDRRRAHLGLTPAGRAIDVAETGTIEAAVDDVLQRTSPRSLEGARELLEALAQALEDTLARSPTR